MRSIGKGGEDTIIKGGWGSRGNLPFWNLIDTALQGVDGTKVKTKKDLVELIKQLHRVVTNGKELTADSYEYSPALTKGSGMSDGWIDGYFWLSDDIAAIDKIAEYLNLK